MFIVSAEEEGVDEGAGDGRAGGNPKASSVLLMYWMLQTTIK
jgi:hypothetical protein